MTAQHLAAFLAQTALYSNSKLRIALVPYIRQHTLDLSLQFRREREEWQS